VLYNRTRFDYVDNKEYGVYAITAGYVKEIALEQARVAIMRRTKSKDILVPRSEYPFTKKPAGSRMGGGKGKVDHWAAKCEAGQVILEFSCDDEMLAKEAFKQVQARLPLLCHLRKAPLKGRKEVTPCTLLEMFAHDAERRQRTGVGRPLLDNMDRLQAQRGTDYCYLGGVKLAREEHDETYRKMFGEDPPPPNIGEDIIPPPAAS